MRKDLEKKAEPITAALAALGALGKSVLTSRALGTGMQKLLEKIPAARNFRAHAAREGILAGLNGEDLLPKHRRTLSIPFGASGSGLVDYEMSKELAKHMMHSYEQKHGKRPDWKTIQDMREGIKSIVSKETRGLVGPSSPLYDQIAGTVHNHLSGQGGAAPLSPITRNIVTALQNDELPTSRLMDHLRKYRGTDAQSSKAGLPLAASKGVLESLLTGNPAHIPMSMLGSTVDAIPELAVTDLANKGKDISKILDLKKGIIGEGIMDSLDPVRKKHWGSKAKDLILGGADHTSGEFRALGKDIGNFVEEAQGRGMFDSSKSRDILSSVKKELIEPARNVATLGVPVGKALLGDPKQTSRPMALELMIRQALQPIDAPPAIKKNAPIGRVVGNVSSKLRASPTISYKHRFVDDPSVPALARQAQLGPATQPQQAYNKEFFKVSSLLKMKKVALEFTEANTPIAEDIKFLADTVGKVMAVPTALAIGQERALDFYKKPDIEKVRARFAKIKDDPRLANVKVRLGYADPVDDVRSLFKRKDISMPMKYLRSLGAIPSAVLAPMRADHYNPFTDSISVFGDMPEIISHEIGHAQDFNRSKHLKGARILSKFLLDSRLPGMPITQLDESMANVEAEKNYDGDIRELRRRLWPARTTYLLAGLRSGGKYFPKMEKSVIDILSKRLKLSPETVGKNLSGLRGIALAGVLGRGAAEVRNLFDSPKEQKEDKPKNK